MFIFVLVNLKWGKQVFKEVAVPLAPGGFELFQAQIYSLTSVPPERQKLLFKGKQIKDLNPTVIKPVGHIYIFFFTFFSVTIYGCHKFQLIFYVFINIFYILKNGI